MKTDIQIAQEAQMEPIGKVAESIGVYEHELEYYGKYKVKLSDEMWERIKDNENGRLVLVTAINPTPAGEGKTTTTVGLADGMRRIGKKVMVALREPSLGPVFGIKGGAAGGGYAQVVPMEDINLHFTGDFHAIGAANNLLAAMLDNHIQQGNELGIDVRKITWKRVVDMNDRQLRNVVDPSTREVIKNPNRRTRPMVRRPGASEWEDITWDDAVAEIARWVKDTRDATFETVSNGITVNRCHGIASLGGSQQNSEEEYLIKKMMRSLGVIAIDNQARV